MNKSFLSMLVLSLTLTVRSADYTQEPGHFGGGGASDLIAIADEFVFAQDTLVESVVWWGEDAEPGLFKVRIFSDNGGEPGSLLLEIEDGNIRKHRTGKFVNAEIRHRDSLYPEYKFTLLLPAPFAAEGQTKYWLSIGNHDLGGGWLWEVSGSLENLGIQRSIFTDPIFGPWTPYFDNMAFELKAVHGRR